uniref:Uncharacterized protein n=1 Tax=Rangifer tarandus platyrhynchus TaxID=3082113 RepID=A0ACB0E604_RANTA|nr:unnamed protein product [Rangifer tarandus platyrhynchus]
MRAKLNIKVNWDCDAGRSLELKGALSPLPSPKGCGQRERGTATLTKAFDPRRHPSRPGKLPEPTVTGPSVQKGLLEGAGCGGNPWIGSLRGVCREEKGDPWTPWGQGRWCPRVSAMPPEGLPGVGEGRRERGAESAEPSRLSQTNRLKSKGRPGAGGSRKDNVCLREKSKQQHPEHCGMGVAEKAAARRTGATVGGLLGARDDVGPQPGRVGPGEPAEGLHRDSSVDACRRLVHGGRWDRLNSTLRSQRSHSDRNPVSGAPRGPEFASKMLPRRESETGEEAATGELGVERRASRGLGYFSPAVTLRLCL